MKLTQLAYKTLRDTGSDAETSSHALLLQAGFIHQLGAGIYSYLPLALKAIKNIESIIRYEMDKTGAQEILMPHIQPQELWDLTGRTTAFGDNLFTLKDRRQRGLVLAPTHEESVTTISKSIIQSYKDLPFTLYQIQTKFRDEARPRAGLIRVREFSMKDAYSFSANEDSLDEIYESMAIAYKNIYQKCEIPVLMAEADSGAIGGKDSHEFIYPTESGEDTVITCSNCQYTANVEKAIGILPAENHDNEAPQSEISTPGVTTIEEVCDFLNINANQTLKSLCYSADGQLVMVCIRGDLNINEVKLKHILNATELRAASTAEIEQEGLVLGSMSPLGISNINIIGDTSIVTKKNLTAGGNKPGTHIVNINYQRDFHVNQIADISTVTEMHLCNECNGKLEAVRGIEIGHIFKLGSFFSESLGLHFTDQDGKQQFPLMGCYGIGVGRLLAAVVESNHDDKGIIFPKNVSPYQVHLIALNANDETCYEKAHAIYDSLWDHGVTCLFDDRTDQSAGVKFRDSELFGIPLQVIVSPRNLNNDICEIKLRKTLETYSVPLGETIDHIVNSI